MIQYLLTLVTGALAILAGFFGTKFVIARADSFGLIDHPNDRSSHSNPTPRGGGLAFIVAFLGGCGILFAFGLVERDWLLPIVSGGPLIALVGWMDDRNPMSAAARLATHFTAALLVYVLITRGFSQSLEVSFVPASWPVVTFFFCLLFVAWMINLYNFMDGIDGLAATNCVVAALCLVGTTLWQGQPQLAAIYFVLACSVVGFLYFNWAPAKVFMGDSGSTFLGFVFAALALTGKGLANLGFVSNVIVLGCFIVDATYTLAVRAFNGKPVYQAHRDHAFQHAVQMGWSHRRTVVIYSLITVFWLVPLSIGSLIYETLSFLFLGIAYVPLIVLQTYFKAGLEGQLPAKPRLLRSQGQRRKLSAETDNEVGT